MGGSSRPAAPSATPPLDGAAVLEALPTPAALVDPGGRLRAVNAAWRAQAGSLGLRDAAAGAPLHLPAAAAEALAAVLAGRTPGQRVEPAPQDPADGTEGRAAFEIRALSGGPERLALVLLEDVSARRRAAQALQESEQRFRQLAESIDEVFWLTTPDKDVMLYVSPAYERIWGRPRAELHAEPRRWLAAIHPEDREGVIAALSLQPQGAYDVTYRILDAAGRVRWIRDRAFPVRDDAGRVYRIAGVAHDVTALREAAEAARAGEERLRRLQAATEEHVAQRTEDLRRANDALRLAEQRLRQVIDLVPHFVFAKDVDGRFLLVNQAVADAYGTTVEALHGRTDADFAASAAEVRRFRADDLEVIRAGRPKVVPLESITDADGRTRLLSTVKIPFTFSGTSTPAVLGVSTDVTERKRLEDHLLQAQKMEGLGRLAGGIAHDFNNLLTVIAGCLQMLEPPLEGLEEHQHVERIREATERASALTHQLLTFARGQVGAPHPMDLGLLVRQMERLLQRVLGDDIRLRAEVAPDLWAVEADPAQLEQVLLNLAVNARDAMPRGGDLLVRAQNRDAASAQQEGGPLAPPGPCVELQVRDTGVGMDAATLAHIFEPFFTTKSADHGTGLGLATCYGIVRRAGGGIWAESAPGAGTTFRLLLPRCTKPVAAEGAPVPERTRPGGGESVLVVEDHATVREVTVQALARQGYRVQSAATPHEALERAARERGPLHLVVTDVVMPGMSGPELVERLLLLRPGLRVLFVSGYSNVALPPDRTGRPLDLLPKPYTPAALAQRVREVLDRPAASLAP